MKFFTAALFLAASAAALPGAPVGNGVGNHGNSNIRFPVNDDVTIEQAQAKCGDQAQLSCCNKATYAGDSTTVNSGLLSGVLGQLIGGGSGSQGLGLFEGCSELGAQIPIIGIAAQNILNQKCKQNIACCQNSPSEANNNLVGVALPCVALGSIL